MDQISQCRQVKKSNDSSVKYLYEVVNLTDSKSDDNKDQFVKLRSRR